MHRSHFLSAWVLVALFGFSSCSKQARAKRLLESSEAKYQEARASLLSGDAKACVSSARASKALAERAVKLVPSGPGSDRLASQAERSAAMADSAEDPVQFLRLWRFAIVDQDWEMVMNLLDWRSLLEESFPKRLQGMAANDKKAFSEVFRESCERTLGMYRDILSIWKFETVNPEIKGDEAVVRCEMDTLKGKRGIGFWLGRRDGMWRLQDFTIGTTTDSTRFTASLRELETLVGDDVDLTEFLKGKGIFEAFSEVREAASVNPIYLKKPWLGQYVRLVSGVSLTLKGQKVSLEPGRILKVIDQDRDPDGTEYVLVRTPDADITKSPAGKIPAQAVHYVGTDESEMWGTDTSGARP